MLKEILAITGKPGLFKIISHSGKALIVEELSTGKKMPVSARDRVMSLGDIAMYTYSDDKPLGEILDIIYGKRKGSKIDVKEVINGKGLKAEFVEYLPDFDRERVHDSDIKKLFTWYNLLVDNGFVKFTEEEKQEDENKEEDDKKNESESEGKDEAKA